MKSWQLTVCILSVAAMAGCSSAFRLDAPAPVESRLVAPDGSQASAGAVAGATAGHSAQSQVASVELGANANVNASDIGKVGRVIYFDFDSYVVKDDYRSLVEAHAKRLSADRKLHMSIEGHTDERGGREYNLALGQKRAEAVAKSLTLLGAADAQVEAVSFGEERPAVQGNDETAWAQNRRAELKDK